MGAATGCNATLNWYKVNSSRTRVLTTATMVLAEEAYKLEQVGAGGLGLGLIFLLPPIETDIIKFSTSSSFETTVVLSSSKLQG